MGFRSEIDEKGSLIKKQKKQKERL